MQTDRSTARAQHASTRASSGRCDVACRQMNDATIQDKIKYMIAFGRYLGAQKYFHVRTNSAIFSGPEINQSGNRVEA